jgi:hypothetical protein
MSSYSSKYRTEHPEYRELEKIKDRTYANNKYAEDEAYRQRKRDRALAYYYKKKEQLKQAQPLQVI